MGNDIRITVSVGNQSAGGLAAVNSSLQTLKTRANEAGNKLDGLAAKAGVATTALLALRAAADDAGDSLRELRRRAEAAGNSMRDLRDGTVGTNNSLRTLNTRAQTANTRLGDLSSSSRTLRSDTDDLDGSMRRLSGTLGGLRGNLGTIRTSSSSAGGGMNGLRKAALLLSPALIPIAAAAVPIAGSLLAATAAVGVFGLAIGGQVAEIAKASDAEKKYRDAVKEHGKSSAEAAKAETEYLRTVRAMDPATRRAAAAFTVFKDQYKEWTGSLAGDTMPVLTKSFATFGSLLPKLSPLVRGTSEQLDRLVTVAAGGIQSAGFERFMESFSEFASGALSRATLGLVQFSRSLDAGEIGGGLREFMQFVRETGPLVGDTLSNLGEALGNLLVAASDTGVGILTAVNALAKLVNAVPADALSAFVQLYAALKLVRLGIAGVSAVATAGAVANLTGFVRAARFGGVGSAIAGVTQRMSTLQKVGGSLGVLGVAALAIDALADKARGAPPDVDKLTSSLKALAVTGKFTGELKSTFGDMDGFVDKLGKMKNESAAMEKAKPFLAFSGLGSFADTAVTKIDDLVRGSKSLGASKDDFKAFDESFAAMAKAGHGEQAAKEFEAFKKAALEGGHSLKDFNSVFPEYREAVAGLKAEQELTAQSMGVFGQAAQDTQAKLDAQAESADGLRQAILALNEVNRSAHDAQTQFEGALDGLTESFKKHGATLDADTEAGRANRDAMSQASAAQDALISSGIAAGDSLASMTGKSEKLRGEMMRLATEAFGGNKQAATEYVNTLLGVPSEVRTLIKAEKDEAITGLHAVQTAIEATPGTKSVTVDTLNGAAISALEAVGLKTRQLKNGKTHVSTANGQSLGAIGAVSRALNNLNGKTARTYTTHTVRTINEIITKSKTYRSVHDIVGATGGLFTGSSFKHGFADGGPVRGPGTGTSDEVFAPWLSNGEFVMKKAAVDRYGERFMQLLNEGRLDMPKFAGGGKVTKSEREARKAAAGELTLSYYGRMAGYKNPEIRNQLGSADSVGDLVSSLNKWRSVIQKTTHGVQESRLLKLFKDGGQNLIHHQKKLADLSKSLEKAKDKLNDLKDSASQLSGSVKSGIIGGANITKAAGAEDSRVTINTLMSQMQGSAANSKQFSSMLKSLKGRGLRGDLIEQIAEAGIEGGGMETAAAILGGGSSEIKKINELQKQITANAGAAGKTAADAMYAAGIKAAEGLVKGLQSKEDQIEKHMILLAKKMEAALKKALKIKSPSKVMEEVGSFTAEGFAVGMRKNRSVTPAWESMLNVPRGGTTAAKRADAAAGGAAGGDRPIVLNVSLGGREFGQIWVDVGRKEVSTRGGLKAALGGMP